MRRFCVLSTMFLLCVICLLSGACFFLPDVGLGQTMLGLELVKRDRLRSVPGKRIVLVGGSNVAFGIDSLQIEKAIGRPVVNMGLHAGLGLCYNLASVRPLLHEGDSVFILAEYSNFRGEACYGGLETLGMMVDVLPSGAVELDLQQWGWLSRYIVQYGAKKVKNLRKVLKGSIGDEASNYNEYGDRIAQWKDKVQCRINGSSPKKERPLAADSLAIRYLSEFVEYCHVRGVGVWVMPPNRLDEVVDDAFAQSYYNLLDCAGIPRVGDVFDYAVARDCMYDNSHHLNNKGRELVMPRRVRDMSHVIAN